jgi:MFS family permease
VTAPSVVRPSAARTTAAATAASVVAVLAPFLVGASGVLLRHDLGISEVDIGLAVSCFFAASAVSAPPAGRLAEYWGAMPALAVVMVGGAAVLTSLAMFVAEFGHLLAALIIAGAVNGLCQPASALAIAVGESDRPALMFGLKQSAIPLAMLVAGASVPLLGVTVGWRWIFGVAALLAVVLIRLPLGCRVRARREPFASRDSSGSLAHFIVLAVAMGLGTAAATAIAAFLVPSSVAVGLTVTQAGWLLVAGSIAGVLARLVAGWWADREADRAMPCVSVMLLLGAGGFALLSVGVDWLLPVAVVVAYAFGLGWTGLLVFAVVRMSPGAPGAATGVVQSGSAAGAAAGPVLFGLAVERASFAAAWLLSAAGLLAASCVVALVWSRLRRRTRVASAAHTPR